MNYDPEKHHTTGVLRSRRSIRLKGYDYAQAGAYFVTLCTQHRECLLGQIVDGTMQLSPLGNIVYECWHRMPEYFSGVELDEFVVMPNHIHGVIIIVGAKHSQNYANASPLPEPHQPHGTESGSLGAIIQNYKSVSTRKINQLRGDKGLVIWQRNYYEHIVRDEDELNRVRGYITANPSQWLADRNNPKNTTQTPTRS